MAYMLYRIRLPIIRVKRGLVNLLGIGACSISSEKGDRATLRNARLIASIAAFLGRHPSEEIESLSTYS